MKAYKVSTIVLLMFIVVVSLCLTPSLSFCANKTWYVSAAMVNDEGDGASWSTASKKIQTAIGKATGGDTVIVRAGTYNEYNISYGGLAITVQAEYIDNPECEGTPACIEGAESYIAQSNGGNTVFLFTSGEYSSSVLQGFTIRNGEGSTGGGIKVRSSSTEATSPTIKNCIIRDNNTTNQGGGIFVSCDLDSKYSRPTFVDCKFINNTANNYQDGGAMFIANGGMPTFRNCLFEGNSVQGAGSYGSVARIEGTTAMVNMLNCTIINNYNLSSVTTYDVISLNNTALASTFINCIIRNPGLRGKEISFSQGTQIVDHAPAVKNCNILDDNYDLDTEHGSRSDNYDLDVQFTGSGDYHLAMNSPDINSGVAGTSADIDGVLRPYALSNNWDVGAYEFNFCYLVENDINRVTTGDWNAANGQWKDITVDAAASGSGAVVDADVVAGSNIQNFETHFYKLSFSGGSTGVLRVETKDSDGGFGNTYGYLIDANQCDTGKFLAEDDNGAEDGRNFKIDYPYIDGSANTYYLAVKGRDASPYDLEIWLQTDAQGNMCSNSVVDSVNYRFNNTFFDGAGYSQVGVPDSGTAAIDFDDDIDVYKIEFGKPGTLVVDWQDEIELNDKDFEIRLKDSNCDLIETEVIYEDERLIADIYDSEAIYLEIKTASGVGAKNYALKLDFYPPDYWYDVITAVLPSESWQENGISTKGGLEYDPANGLFEIEGNGLGLDDDERDQAYFVYKNVAGDFDFSVNVKELAPTEASSYEELAGVMARTSLSQGSKNVFAGFTPNNPATGTSDGTFQFKYRALKDQDGVPAVTKADSYQTPTGNDNPNVRIRREGNDYFSYFYNINTASWEGGTGDYVKTLEGVGNIIGSKALVGMAVTSCNTRPDYMFIDDGPAVSTNGGSSVRQYYKCRIDHTSNLVNRPWIEFINYTGYETYSFKNMAAFSPSNNNTESPEYLAAVTTYLTATAENRPRLYKKSGIGYVGFEAKKKFADGNELFTNLPRERNVKRSGLSSSGDPIYSYRALKDHTANNTNYPLINMVRYDPSGVGTPCKIYTCIKENGPGTAAGVKSPTYAEDNDYWQYNSDYDTGLLCDGSGDEPKFVTYSSSEKYGPAIQADDEGDAIWQVIGYSAAYNNWTTNRQYGKNYLEYWNDTAWDTNYDDLESYYSTENLTQLAGVTAEQSSTYGDPPNERVADEVIDGVTNGDGESNCSHTLSEPQPWVQIDLGADYDIHEIRIYNRTDGSNPERLDDFYIFVTKTNMLTSNSTTPSVETLAAEEGSVLWHSGKLKTFSNNNRFMVNKGNGYNGRYVIVKLGGTNFLNLAEVQVMRYNANPANLEIIGKSWDYWRTTSVDPYWVDGNNATAPEYHTWALNEKYGTYWQEFWKKTNGDLEINGKKIEDLSTTLIWDENFKKYETSQATKAIFNNVSLDTTDLELGEPGETGAITIRPAKVSGDSDIFEFQITNSGKLTAQTTGCAATEISNIEIYNALGEKINTSGGLIGSTGNYLVDGANVGGSNTPVDLIVSPGTYYLRVSAPDGDIFEYGVKVNCDTGAGDDHGDYLEFSTILEKWPVNLSPLLYFRTETGNIEDDADNDYFRFDIPKDAYPNGGIVRIMTDYAVTTGGVAGILLDSAGRQLGESSDTRIANPYYPAYQPLWNKEKLYKTNDKVSHGANFYECLLGTVAGEEPGIAVTKWAIIPMNLVFSRWEAGTYHVNDLVYNAADNDYYRCIKETNEEPLDDPVDWEFSGVPFVSWVPGEYKLKDVVFHIDAYYKCTADSTNFEPSGISADWSIVATPPVSSYMIEKKLNAGTYYIVLSSGAAVDYELSVDFDDYGDTRTTAHPFDGYNAIKGHFETVKGSVSPWSYDPDVFELFVPNENMVFTIYTTGDSVTYGNLVDSSGALIVQDSAPPGGNFSFSTGPLSAGTYYIQTCMKDTATPGDYMLHMDMFDDFVNTWSACPAEGNDGEVVWNCIWVDEPSKKTKMGDLAVDTGGVIEIPADLDLFKYEAPGAGRVTIISTGTLDTLGSLYRYKASNRTAAIVAWNNDGTGDNSGNFKLEYDVDGGVTYLLKVKGQFPQDTGSYGLTVSYVAAGGSSYDEDNEGDTYKDAKILSPGGLPPSDPTVDYTGGIDLEGDYDYYTFVVTGTGLLKVWTTTPSGQTLDTYGYLYAGVTEDTSGEDGLMYEFLASNDDNPENTVSNDFNFGIQYHVDGSLAYTGKESTARTIFYVKVKAFQQNKTGIYDLHVSFTEGVDDNDGNTCATATEIGPDYLPPGLAIDMQGDKDYFKFVTGPETGPVTGPVIVGTDSRLMASTTTPDGSELDLFGYLKNYMCSTVIINDNGTAGNDNFSIGWTHKSDNPEVYYVGIRDFEDKKTGPYALNLDTNGTFLKSDENLTWIPLNRDTHYFGFEIPEEASTLKFTCTGSDVDTEFKLLSGEDGLNTKVNFTISTDQDNNFTITNPKIDPGTYFVMVKPLGDSVTGMVLNVDKWYWTDANFTGDTGSGEFNLPPFKRLPNAKAFEMEVTGVDPTAGNNDIWGTNDKGYFAYRAVRGDFEISAKVTINGADPAAWAKGGVMVRDTIVDTSANVFVAYTPGHGCTRQRRFAAGVTASDYDDNGDHRFVRIVRKDDTYTFYTSRNETDWQTTDIYARPTDGTLTGEVLVGLAASPNENGTRSFTFEEVKFINDSSGFE